MTQSIMQDHAIHDAVDALVAARRSGKRIAALRAGSRPADIAAAHAIQDATVPALGEHVAGWKVAVSAQGVMRGVILGSRMRPSPAELPAADLLPLGIEAEIAFRFDRDLPARPTDYAAEEVAAAATAVVGIEIVASRFEDYANTPLLDRAADCMSNGAFIIGTRRPQWRCTELSQLQATVRVNGRIAVQKTGGHPAGDPLLPAVALVNALRHATGVRAGQLITTGTYTGLHFVAPGDAIAVEFTDFGTAAVTLTR
ncbi:MAG: 2-keto-4-pentenoate hydratase [Acetobacteraceae bacterium]